MFGTLDITIIIFLTTIITLAKYLNEIDKSFSIRIMKIETYKDE